ncbi:phage portal protein, partial [Carboxydocella sp. ULO1]
TTGVPPNLDDLKTAVRAVVPAHLAIMYEYNFFIWDEWDAKAETWDTFDALGMTWDALEVRN